MATYVNNLRLTEITTGDEDGTWGTTTNSNWDFATDAFGYGVKNMAGDADQTFTMADGTVDTLRSMYLKITSTVAPLTATRTLTIAPNTVSKVWIIENNAAGSQSIIIKQGSGAEITIATGTRAMVYTDGAGAGAAVFLASPTISTLAGTVLVANGGTSLTTLTANNVILGNGASAPTFVAPSTSGNVLTSNGTTWSSTAPATSGTVTSVAASVPSIFSISGSPITSSGTLAMTYSGTALPVANGGTSLTTLTANNVILGNGASAPTFVAPSSSGNVLTSNGTTWASSAPAAGGIVYTVTKTTTYTAVANDGVLTNTTGGAFTVTLPASPANGDQVIIADAGGTWGTNNLTVGRNGNNIADVAQDLVCDISGVSVQFVYNTSGTATWEVYAQVGGNGGTVVTLDGTQTLTNKTLTAPTIASANLTTALTLAGAAGTNGQVLTSAGSGLPSWTTIAAGPTIGTPVASTSGTSIDFTGIPAATKRITLMMANVSSSGIDDKLLQLGDSGGIETTGYLSNSSGFPGGAIEQANSTAGFAILGGSAGRNLSGSIVISLENSSSFTWVVQGVLAVTGASNTTETVAGRKSLTSVLDRIRLTTTNGTDTFDLGEVNISYE